MTKPMIKIVNSETGQEIEREMNATEYAQYEIDQAKNQQLKNDEATKAAAKKAIATRLGLTADELALLLG